MIHASKIVFKKGKTLNGCAAASFAMLFNIDEVLARKAVKTKYNGTCMYDVFTAVKATGLNAIFVRQDIDFNLNKDFLRNLSIQFPVLASMQYRHGAAGGGRGRDKREQHAVLLADGMIFDSAQNKEVDFDCYEYTNDKGLKVNDLIIIDEERPYYGKKECFTNF